MIIPRYSAERGHSSHGWLDTWHTFSFATYYDPAQMGFRALRVLNEDRIGAGRGFGTHEHRDMEIVTYVLEGALKHRDNVGNRAVMRPGDVQRLTAGSGVTHSEFNASKKEEVHLLQIWILPDRLGLEPSYEQRTFTLEERSGVLKQVASGNPTDQALRVHQDVHLFASILSPGQRVIHHVAAGRYAWLQVVRGMAELNGVRLAAGDGARVVDERLLETTATTPVELLLFDLS